MPNPIVHWEIQSNQPEKLQKFYGNLFDWHVNADNPMNYGMVDAHDEKGIGGGIGGTNGGPNQLVVYAEVDDLDKYLRKAEGLGGKTIVPPTEVPGQVTFALFADPEGNMFGMTKAMPGQ